MKFIKDYAKIVRLLNDLLLDTIPIRKAKIMGIIMEFIRNCPLKTKKFSLMCRVKFLSST
jgi:hypothetical protein